MPAANPQAREDAQAFMRRVTALEIACCPHCKIGCWRVQEQLPANRAALAALTPTHAVGRHERHTLPHVPCQVWLRTQAGVSTCRPRRGGRRCAAQAGFSDAGGASGAITRWWAPRATRCATHRSCQHAPLKLTLPIPPPCRRFSSTRFICRHGAPWLRSALPGRQINAVC